MKSILTLKWALIALVLSTVITSCSENSEEINSEKSDIEKLNEIYGISNESEQGEPKKPVVIGNLEIAGEDFPEKLDWSEAKKECQKMGDGWRLPTIEELDIMYVYKDKIGGFEEVGPFAAYWSTTRYEFDETQLMTLSFYDGLRYKQVLGVANKSFRPVRDKK